jgi:hypothetical protein
MPDPADPTPCRAEKRGNLWVVVGKDGKKVAGAGAYKDEASAKAEAATINESWKRAKSERKQKGLEEALGRGGRTLKWDPKLHPRDRLGQFAETLRNLSAGETVKVKGPQGTIKVRNSGDEFVVTGGGQERRRWDNLRPPDVQSAAEDALKRAGMPEPTEIERAEARPPAERRTRAEALYPRQVREIDKLVAPVMAEKPGGGEREGLEGPFRYRSGWEGYYDPKEGRYYDPKSDRYMPRDFDPETGMGRGLGTVGDVLRAKSAGGETTSEWAKRVSAESRRESRVRKQIGAAVKPDSYEMGLAEKHLRSGKHEGHSDERVAEEIHRQEYRYAYAEFSEEDAEAQHEADIAALTAAVELVRRRKKPGSKMSRRSGHDLLIEAPRAAVRFDPSLHPRDRLGQFREVLGNLSVGQRAVISGANVTVVRTRSGYKIDAGRRKAQTKSASGAAVRALRDAGVAEPRVEAGFTRRGKRPVSGHDVRRGEPSVVQDVDPETISRRMAERFGMEYIGPGSERRPLGAEAGKGSLTVSVGKRPLGRGEFEQGDRVTLPGGRTGVVIRKVRGGTSTFGGGPRADEPYVEPEYMVSIDSQRRGTAALGWANEGVEQVKHSDLSFGPEELATRRGEIEQRMERAAKPTKKAIPAPRVGVTLSRRMIPQEWAIEHGYGEMYRPSSQYGFSTRQEPGFRWKPNVDEERMLFHFLYGRKPPENFPEGSAAAEQWTYKPKGTKAERERLARQLALVREARKRAAAEGDHVAFTRHRREERELRAALRLLEARPTTYSFDPRLHPRNRLGQFTDVLGILQKAPRGSEVSLPHGVSVRRRGGTFDVRAGQKRVGTHLRREQAAKKALSQVEKAEAAAPKVRKHPDIARIRRLADEMGLFAEKPEEEERPPEIGERVLVLPQREGGVNLRGRLIGRENGRAEVQVVTSRTTQTYPSERVLYAGAGVEKPESVSDPVGQVLTLGIGGKFTLRGKRYTMRDFGNWTHGHGYSVAPVWNEKGRSTTVRIKDTDKITDLDDSGGWHPWMGSRRPQQFSGR